MLAVHARISTSGDDVRVCVNFVCRKAKRTGVPAPAVAAPAPAAVAAAASKPAAASAKPAAAAASAPGAEEPTDVRAKHARTSTLRTCIL